MLTAFAMILVAANVTGCGDSNDDEPTTSAEINANSSPAELIVGVWNHEDYTKPRPGHMDKLTITKDGKIVSEYSSEAPVRDENGQITSVIQDGKREGLYKIEEDGETISFFKLDGTPIGADKQYKIKFRTANEMVISYTSEVGNPYNAFTYIRAK